MANVTLQGSIATLSYALEHLPELTYTFQEGHKYLGPASERFAIRLEIDEAIASNAVSGAASIGPNDVQPMELDGITAVDDLTFMQRIKANGNLPQWLRAAL